MSCASQSSTSPVRQFNRRVVLNAVRTRQPISRAGLIRALGMQPSTVSMIVRELIAEDWLVEIPSRRVRPGRPIVPLRVNDHRAAIGVEIGAAETSVVVASLNGQIDSEQTLATPSDPQQAVAAIVSSVRQALQAHPGRHFEGIGLCHSRRTEIDFSGALSQSTGLNVECDTTANGCALAGAYFSRLGPAHSLVAMEVSDTIATGILLEGKPLHSPGDFTRAGDWAQQGCNRAALDYYLARRPRPEGLLFSGLVSLAGFGDRVAVQALENMAVALGRGMQMIAAALAPQYFLVFGDIALAWPRIGALVERGLARSRPTVIAVRPENPVRRRAALALVAHRSFENPKPGLGRSRFALSQ